jgi:glutamate 5-kinase
MKTRADIKNSQRWVVKIGSALLTNGGQGLNHQMMKLWVGQMVALKKQGIELILVSSGSVAEGMLRLGWNTRPTNVNKLQAAAAVGQMGLIQSYEVEFAQHNILTAQILLTHDDLSNKQRNLNASGTIKSLIDSGVVPIINENDTVITDEIRFGDNDTLAALIANLVCAEVLVILTDQKGLYDQNPRINKQAKLISEAKLDNAELENMASPEGGSLGRGGMYTKIIAAKKAATCGAVTFIASGTEKNILPRIFAGENLGTFLYGDTE